MGDVSMDGSKPYGQNNWLDWSRANWGSKWDAYGFDDLPQDTPENTLWFLSANQPPHPVIQRLSEMLPDVVMELLWADANLGYGCGTCTYQAGQKIEECYKQNAALERQELADLRELVFHLQEDVYGDEPEDTGKCHLPC